MKNTLLVFVWFLSIVCCFSQSIKRTGFTTNNAGDVIDASGSIITNINKVVTTNLTVRGGTLGAAKVLTDVAGDGVATWETAPGAAGGEVNTASVTGSGVGIVNVKSLVDLPFKSFVDDVNGLLTWTTNGTEITGTVDWATLTNGLATLGYVQSLTNGFVGVEITNGFVGITITNGLASIAYVDSVAGEVNTAASADGNTNATRRSVVYGKNGTELQFINLETGNGMSFEGSASNLVFELDASVTLDAEWDTSAEFFSNVGDETGTGQVMGNVSPVATNILAYIGDSSTPSYSFLNDAATGMFNPIGESVGFSADGSEIFRITASGITLFSGIFTLPDDTRQTFNPGATVSGLNVGSQAGDPSTPINGDLWYDSTAEELTGRINGVNVSLGSGGGGEVNTTDNLGTGVGIASAKTSTVLNFKSFPDGTGYSWATNGTEITLTLDSSIIFSTEIDTSAELAGILGDETGTGLVVLGTDATITTPTISGAVVFPDGVRQTFNPDGTTPGLSVGSQAGDPSTPANGDIWYDSTAEELTARINGANVTLGAVGSGDTNFPSINVSNQIKHVSQLMVPTTFLTNFTVDFAYREHYYPMTNHFHLAGSTSTSLNFSNAASAIVRLYNSSGGALTVSVGTSLGLSGTNYVSVPTGEEAMLEVWTHSASSPDMNSRITLYDNPGPAGGAGTPGGSDLEIQYNNSGSFGGISDLIWDGTQVIWTNTTGGNAFVFDGGGGFKISIDHLGMVADGNLTMGSGLSARWFFDSATGAFVPAGGVNYDIGQLASTTHVDDLFVDKTWVFEALYLSNLVADRVLILNGLEQVTNSAVTTTELALLSGVTGTIANQAYADSTTNGLITQVLSNGVSIGYGTIINFIPGANVTLAMTNGSGVTNDVVIASSGGGGGLSGGDFGAMVMADWAGDGVFMDEYDPMPLFEEFIFNEPSHDTVGQLGFDASANGSGSADNVASLTELGVLNLSTGNGTTSGSNARAQLGDNTLQMLSLTNLNYRWWARVRVPTLSTASEEFIFRCGVRDGNSGLGTDSVIFEYDRLSEGANWQCTTLAGSTEDGPTDSNVAVSAGDWVHLEFQGTNDNSRIVFSIDGTTVATNDTTIPQGSANFFFQIEKVTGAGATPSTTEVGKFYFHSQP